MVHVLSEELSNAEFEEICAEVNARFNGSLVDLSDYATPSSEAIRQTKELVRSITNNVFQFDPFEVDRRRIIHSKAFERLGDKTQVCTMPVNPHITNRSIHSMRVASLGKTIARGVGANVNLTEAIGEGHDLGHSFFGHVGERAITDYIAGRKDRILRLIGAFKHNIQSLHVVDRVEHRTGFPKSTGLNLTDQVRHGILSHDGERDLMESVPNSELLHHPELIQGDINRYVREVIESSGDKRKGDTAFVAANAPSIQPATMEGAIIKMSDVLHYAPEDFEDLVSLGVIKRHDLPTDISRHLGNDGATIMNTLVNDLIIHSYGKDRMRYSSKIGELLNKFKREFLYDYYPRVNVLATITDHDPRVKAHVPDLEDRLKRLFEHYLEVLENPEKYCDSAINHFRDGRDEVTYNLKMEGVYGPLNDEEYRFIMIMDFIAGFTDSFFISESDKLL